MQFTVFSNLNDDTDILMISLRAGAGLDGLQYKSRIVVHGELDYSPDPVEPPAEGSALICCSQPRDDVVLDL